MKVDEKKCVGCGNCVLVCTMGAIYIENGHSNVNEDECVECGSCIRFLEVEGRNPTLVRGLRKVLNMVSLQHDAPVGVCVAGALYEPTLEWPREIRRNFSNPAAVHSATGIPGRGTDEIKTNDVNEWLKEKEALLLVEVGRPGLGARMRDIEKITTALAALGVDFKPENPITLLMTDTKTGKLNPDTLNEKVLSAIIEIKIDLDKVPVYLKKIKETVEDFPTVCSLVVAGRCNEHGDIPYTDAVRTAGLTPSPGGKTNLGLGRRGGNE